MMLRFARAQTKFCAKQSYATINKQQQTNLDNNIKNILQDVMQKRQQQDAQLKAM